MKQGIVGLLASSLCLTLAVEASAQRPSNGPPATVAESSLTEMPQSITLPPTSMTVYEFDVR